jgi:hypothetical protein
LIERGERERDRDREKERERERKRERERNEWARPGVEHGGDLLDLIYINIYIYIPGVGHREDLLELAEDDAEDARRRAHHRDAEHLQ